MRNTLLDFLRAFRKTIIVWIVLSLFVVVGIYLGVPKKDNWRQYHCCWMDNRGIRRFDDYARSCAVDRPYNCQRIITSSNMAFKRAFQVTIVCGFDHKNYGTSPVKRYFSISGKIK